MVRELCVRHRLATLHTRGDDECCYSGGGVNCEAAGEIEHAELRHPPVGVPNPVREWVVDEEGPNRDEDEECVELELFSPRSRDDWGRGRREEVGETEHKTNIGGSKEATDNQTH